MLSSTVFTVCLLTAITLFLEASPVQGKYFTGYDLFQRAAVKAARVFVHGRSDHLRSRQQTYAPGDPVYQAEVFTIIFPGVNYS